MHLEKSSTPKTLKPNSISPFIDCDSSEDERRTGAIVHTIH
uniref:Uncharacterized protein n=1 Tax=Rhizophora mucronata TaxID=61149 RepID=A0A2P2QVY8_RHIMU